MSFPLPRLAQVALVALLAAPALASDPTYTYVDLGTLGGPSSVAMGLNESRQVVGWSSIPGCTVNGHPCRRAFLWDGGVMTDLGVLAGDEESMARAINESGLVVGTSESDIVAGSGTFHGFSWNGSMTALPDLGQGQSFAHDVNDAGVIAGHTQDPAFNRDRAVTWSGGVISNVGASEPHQSSRAQGINEAGEIVGFAWNLFSPNDAVLFDGSWFTIGGLDGPFQNAEARDLNDSGLAVGLQAFPQGDWHPAVWTSNPPGAIDLGVLPGHELGELFDVNDGGLAVGRSYDGLDPFDSRAVFYDGSKLRDLNDLLPAGVDGVLFEAREINEQGDIVGTAVVDGEFRAFLMVRDDPWQDLGLGLAGVSGVPALEAVGSLCAGDPLDITLTDAVPSATAFLIVGVARIDAPFKGGVVVPAFEAPLGLFLTLPTDASGGFALAETWPGGLPAGTELFLQCWLPDAAAIKGFAASNAVSGLVP
jgi:probable HAF family extracellular repeat protein